MSESKHRGKLTQRQHEYFSFICQFFVKHRRLPKMRDVSLAMQLTNPASAHYVIQALIRKGYLVRGESCGFQFPDHLPEQTLTARIMPGQILSLGDISIGIFEVDRETGEVGVEIIAPEIMGELQREA